MAASRALEALKGAPTTLIQDLGRIGFASIGVGSSGAADRGAFRLGARLLAQPYSAAALEVTFGGLSVRARGDLQLALTGAQAPATVDGRAVGYFGPFTVADGQVLTFVSPSVGLRSYLSVRGGIAVAPVLGSRSTDTLSGLGPPPLRARRTRGPEPKPPRGFSQPGRRPRAGDICRDSRSARTTRPTKTTGLPTSTRSPQRRGRSPLTAIELGI